MRKLILLLFLLTTTSAIFAQRVNSLIPNRLQNDPALLNRIAEGDTVFFFDGTYYVFGDEDAGGDFEIGNLDFDNGVPFFSDNWDTDWSFWYSLDASDANPGDFSPDTASYVGATSYFTDATIKSNNWLVMGPIPLPNDGAVLSWYYKASPQVWVDGYEVYVSANGGEPYEDVDPYSEGGSDYPIYTKEARTWTSENQIVASDTVWNQYSASLNDWAGNDVWIYFHHNTLDGENIYLDNFAVIETDDMNTNENLVNNLTISPNPSNGIFTVTSNTSDITTIEVVNILGEVIDSRVVEGTINETFDMTSFSAGMYFVKSSNGTTESTQRIIIK